ncbi:hypothetical protein Ssi02_10720 [Sinosporangium siamense]|uniref:Uncharacterized protein n=1 Tax=Sinosporangium siamense TaxID=1367973 RepID=A0A919V5G7_9ACTN|nr:hypothetical protein Ssi02_10720 [Sinosporangium siamense]
MAEMLPNPLCRELSEALRLLEPLGAEVQRDLDEPVRMFRAGGVWTGPAARRFDAQLAQYGTRVRVSADRVIAELRGGVGAGAGAGDG